MATAFLAVTTIASRPAQALERLCDTSHEDCRAPLLKLIQNEKVRIDIAFWFMSDPVLGDAIVKRHKAGVPIRLLVDPTADGSHDNAELTVLKHAGIPIRRKVGAYILHWKLMVFAGQHTVEFSAANFSNDEFVPYRPYQEYNDEAVSFTDQPPLVQSFMTRYDDLWTSNTMFQDYANVRSSDRRRAYPTSPIDPRLNFPPFDSYATRLKKLMDAETVGIDIDMFRITQSTLADAAIRAFNRGVAVRLYTEQQQYRDPTRIWHSYNVDRMWYAGIDVKDRKHGGLNHEKAVVLEGQGFVVFGSSNWTSASDNKEVEHNEFTDEPSIYLWFKDIFERKWFNQATVSGRTAKETHDFVPLPPDPPRYHAPANQSTGTPTTLQWTGGHWGHIYDIYFGTSPTPPLYQANLYGGPDRWVTVTLPKLKRHKTYYWGIVSKTMAYQTATGPLWSFTTP